MKCFTERAKPVVNSIDGGTCKFQCNLCCFSPSRRSYSPIVPHNSVTLPLICSGNTQSRYLAGLREVTILHKCCEENEDLHAGQHFASKDNYTNRLDISSVREHWTREYSNKTKDNRDMRALRRRTEWYEGPWKMLNSKLLILMIKPWWSVSRCQCASRGRNTPASQTHLDPNEPLRIAAELLFPQQLNSLDHFPLVRKKVLERTLNFSVLCGFTKKVNGQHIYNTKYLQFYI